MLTEMPIAVPASAVPTPQALPTHIAHRVPTHAGQLIAATVLDEGQTAAGAGAFQGRRAGGFDGAAERHGGRFEADVWIVPDFRAVQAGWLAACWGAAVEG